MIHATNLSLLGIDYTHDRAAIALFHTNHQKNDSDLFISAAYNFRGTTAQKQDALTAVQAELKRIESLTKDDKNDPELRQAQERVQQAAQALSQRVANVQRVNIATVTQQLVGIFPNAIADLEAEGVPLDVLTGWRLYIAHPLQSARSAMDGLATWLYTDWLKPNMTNQQSQVIKSAMEATTAQGGTLRLPQPYFNDQELKTEQWRYGCQYLLDLLETKRLKTLGDREQSKAGAQNLLECYGSDLDTSDPPLLLRAAIRAVVPWMRDRDVAGKERDALWLPKLHTLPAMLTALPD